MARPIFWPTLDSSTLGFGGVPYAGVPVRIFTRQRGGTQVTDITYVGDDGSIGIAVPSGVLYSDQDGLIPAFAGPDGGATTLWGDHGIGGTRVALTSDPAGGGGGSVGPGGIGTTQLADGAVTPGKLSFTPATAGDLAAKADAAGTASAIAGRAAADLSNVTPATGRSALGLGDAATLNLGTGAGTVAAGDDTRLTNTRTPTDGSVTTAKLAAGAVTAANVAADVATQAELNAEASARTSALNTKADLVGGLIPTSQLPPLAITNPTPVASQAEMLALPAQRGDVAIRTDNGKTFILASDSPTTLADWKEILASGAITSVAGKTGVVALAAADIASGVFDISRLPTGTTGTTVAAGNDARIVGAAANTAVVHNTGTETIAGDKTFSAPPTVPTPTAPGHAVTKAFAEGLAAAGAPDATTAAKGIVRLTGDLAGTATAPVVARLNGVTVTGTPAAGQAPLATSPTTAVWGNPPGGVSAVAGSTGAVTTVQIQDALHVIEGVTVYAARYGVVADSNGTAGNGTDNTTALRAAFAAAAAITNSVTGQNWIEPRIILPAGPGVIRFTDWIVNTPDAAGATVAPVRGLRWQGHGRRSVELFFDRAGTATEDPRLNTAFVLGNRALGWVFSEVSFRSLNANNSCFWFWCRDTDDSVLAMPALGRGAQSNFRFEGVEWRGQWKRAIGWGGDHQANLNSEFIFDECAIPVDATFTDAAFHLGMPMYGALHMRVTGGATGGTYTITVGANTTSALAYNASAATIQAALTGLASVGSGNATVAAVSDGFLIRFLNAVEAIDTTTVSVATSLTGGSSPAIVLFRRPIQQSQFLNYWFQHCRFELGGGVLQRIGRGGHITHKNGSYIAVDAGTAITMFVMEDEASHAESTLHFTAEDIRFEMRAANHRVIDCKWNKGWVSFVRCSDSAYSFQSFATTLSAHQYDFTTQGLSRGPIITYRDCELIGLHQFTTHASTAVSGGHVVYEDCRFMNSSSATSATGGTGMARYTGVAVPMEVQRCHGPSLTRITNSKAIWT